MNMANLSAIFGKVTCFLGIHEQLHADANLEDDFGRDFVFRVTSCAREGCDYLRSKDIYPENSRRFGKR